MAVDYSDIFLKSPLGKQSPEAIVALAFLGMARIFPVIGLSPFFGSRVLPHPVKVTLGLCLFVIMMPQMLLKIDSPLNFDLNLILCFIKEFFIGTLLGFFLSMPFLIASTAGTLIDHQRGAASLMVNDPTIQNQTSPLGTLYNMLLIVIFYLIDGPFHVIDALIQSYHVLPPDQFFSKQFFSDTTEVFAQLYTSLQVFISLAVQLCSPALIAILMTDTFLGIINRLAPQVQITFLAMGLKSWLALLIVLAGWKLFTTQLAKELYLWLDNINSMIQSLNIGLS